MNNELFSKIKSDASFAAKIGSAKSIDEAFVIAKDSGLSITLDELKALNANPSAVELSDSELEQVAGGAGYTWGDVGSQCATCKADDQACWS
jgi:predicted ribosomally synthesized peptide with nif11-like leader